MNTTTITIDGAKTELTFGERYRVRYGKDQILEAVVLDNRAPKGGALRFYDTTTDEATNLQPRAIKGVWQVTNTDDPLAELALERAGVNPIDALPDDFPTDAGPLVPDRQDGESGSAYLARLEKELGGDFTRWIGTETGQATLAEAQRVDKEARRGSGPVEIVQPATNGKPTEAARIANGETIPMPADQKPPKLTKQGAAKLAQVAKETGNRPLRLGDKPHTEDGVTVYPILHRDGTIADHQLHNYIWKCPSCSKRLRAAFCDNGHEKVAAPFGYRVDDRRVK